jgi:hypothetical protein
MLGLLTGVRLALPRPSLPRFSVVAVVRRRRQRAAEREYRRTVANGHLPPEFDTPFYREVPQRRWYR